MSADRANLAAIKQLLADYARNDQSADEVRAIHEMEEHAPALLAMLVDEVERLRLAPCNLCGRDMP